jgi:hypothetical protein
MVATSRKQSSETISDNLRRLGRLLAPLRITAGSPLMTHNTQDPQVNSCSVLSLLHAKPASRVPIIIHISSSVLSSDMANSKEGTALREKGSSSGPWAAFGRCCCNGISTSQSRQGLLLPSRNTDRCIRVQVAWRGEVSPGLLRNPYLPTTTPSLHVSSMTPRPQELCGTASSYAAVHYLVLLRFG